MTWGVGQMVGPKVGTYLWQDAGPAALWASCAGLSALVAFTLWITAAPRRARMERAVRDEVSAPSRSGSS